MSNNKQQSIAFELTVRKGMTDEDVAEEMHLPTSRVRNMRYAEGRRRRKEYEREVRERAAAISQNTWRNIA